MWIIKIIILSWKFSQGCQIWKNKLYKLCQVLSRCGIHVIITDEVCNIGEGKIRQIVNGPNNEE